MSWSYRRVATAELDAPADVATPSPAARRSPWREGLTAVTAVLGRLLLAFGILVLLFVAYLLWGTGIYEASHQSALRAQFEKELAGIHHEQGGGNPTSSAASSTTSLTTAPTTAPTTVTPGAVPAEGQPVGILQIPKIGLDKVIVEGTSTDDLRLGPGHYPGTPLPGQAGNSAIAGHRTTYGAPFYDLNELAPGDPIYVTTTQGHFLYKVTQQLVVSPSNLSVVAASSSPELTLTTCNPRFSATQRLVVHATLSLAPGAAPAVAPPPPRPSSTHAKRAASGLAGGQGTASGAIAWGAAFAAVFGLAWLAARRTRRPWIAYGVSAVPLLVLLFFFFANVSPLLPASF